MLRDAREQGVIRFQLTYPASRDSHWERSLRERHRHHGLRDVVVVTEPPASPRLDPVELVGAAAAEWLLGHLGDGQRVSIAWGTSVRSTVNHVFTRHRYAVEVSRLGGYVDAFSARGDHEMVRDLAARLGGTYCYPNVPAVLDSVAEAKALYADTTIAHQLRRASAADIAIVGVGAFGQGSNRLLLDRAGVGHGERDRARGLGVVGEVCGRFYDHDGRDVELPVDQRIISVRTGALVAIPNTVVVAAGARKAAAVIGALRGRMVTTLVCDLPLARAIAALPA
ncbi:sugar-binding transcriptional regulator [Allokutzneria oryzae]|uniref:Sugar-binding transcriptional regulator n=1 Tax=Allokutzneria oryzae TaxID=1378989 RepID=A0ABV5ZQP1_9PSEU